MAPQNLNPGQWHDSMSDGCSGPILMRLLFRDDCVRHDEGYWWGGSVEDKMRLDDKLATDMSNRKGLRGILARNGYAKACWAGVRWGTYNYPPGHPDRSDSDIYVEAFNWEPAYPEGWQA